MNAATHLAPGNCLSQLLGMKLLSLISTFEQIKVDFYQKFRYSTVSQNGF